MNMALTDSDALASIVTALGGTVLTDRRTFQFDLPMSKVKEIVPKINQLTGLRVEKVGERVDSGDARSIDRVQGIATLELRRKPEPTEYERERSLMAAIIR
jgi:hypothetical protein